MHAAFLICVGLAFFGGMLVAAQGPIYARMAHGLGRDYLLAVCLAFTVAAMATGVLAFGRGSFGQVTLSGLVNMPIWVWLGGLFGAVHVAISMHSIPVLGVSLFLVIVVMGNLVGSAIYDHLGAMGLAERPFSIQKAFGLGLVMLGVAVVAKA